jgi:hypothetical protein
LRISPVITVPVESASTTSEGQIQKIAARSFIKKIEQRESYLGYNGFPGKGTGEETEKEEEGTRAGVEVELDLIALRIALKYQILSHKTSFIAVSEEKEVLERGSVRTVKPLPSTMVDLQQIFKNLNDLISEQSAAIDAIERESNSRKCLPSNVNCIVTTERLLSSQSPSIVERLRYNLPLFFLCSLPASSSLSEAGVSFSSSNPNLILFPPLCLQ